MDIRLVEKLQEVQRKDSEYVPGFLDKRTYVTDFDGVDKTKKQNYIEMIKRDPIRCALRDDDRTYKFFYTPMNNTLLGSWENDHFHQDAFLKQRYGLQVGELQYYFKGRLVVDPLATWLFIYQREDQKSIPSWVIEAVVPTLQQKLGQYVELVIDDKKQVLQESNEKLRELLREGRYVEFMKNTLPEAWKSWSNATRVTTNEELLENTTYNEYWKFRLFDAEKWHKFLKENREDWESHIGLSSEERIEKFLSENKIREAIVQ